VELYRPEYAILENVVSMANTRKGFETQNVLSHLVACFVAMGYQVNHYIVDAWSHGSIQQRSRIIMTIAAPGLALIEQLSHTHSLLAEDTAAKSLGRLPNGQRFGAREYHPTPFSFIPAGVATSDLPNIGNGNVQTCVSHPNHRVSHRPGRKEKALLRYIPQDPPGYGYAEAHRLGLIPSSLQIAGKESGGAFRRIKESGLVPTITTNLTIRDSRNGAVTHWSQDRPITILEARRAQGLPDHEPIIGNLAAQYRIVGNGVDRHVAFAVGLSVRNALLKNVKQGGTSSEVETRDMLVDIEGDEDRFSEAAAMPSSCQSEIDSNTPDILGLDGSLDVRNDESMPRPANNSSLLSRMSTTVANSIKGLVYRSKHYPTPTMATPAPSKGSHDEIPEDVDRGSVRHDDRQASASREPRLVDAKERHVGREGLEDAAKDGEVPRKRRRVGTKSRYTRHSGLQVTFTPKQWNQKPEREHRISD
jgi:DNA (cytosine-5)-methyltransferase 1